MTQSSQSGRLSIPHSGVDGSASKQPAGSRLAIHDSTTEGWSLRQDVMGLEEVGVAAIGLSREKLEHESGADGLLSLHASGLVVSSLGTAGGFTGSDGRSHEESVADGWYAARQAALAGARTLVVRSGARRRHTLNHARGMVVDALCSIAELARASDVAVALLPERRALTNEVTLADTIDNALEILGECDHPSLGLAFDTHQLWYEPELIDRVDEFVGVTRLIRLRDWEDAPHESVAVRPGEGRLPLGTFVRRLHDAGFDGFFECSVDVPVVEQRSYVDVLLRCRAGMSGLLECRDPVHG